MAALRGGRALDAEKSLNLAAGMVLERGSFLLTADVFRIDLRDRLGYFDGWWDPRDAWAYGGSYLLDLEAAVRIDASTRLVIGGRNALDEAADLNPNPTVIGNVYSTRAPFDVNDGFYYARLQYRWGGGS